MNELLYSVDGLSVGDVIRYPGVPDWTRTGASYQRHEQVSERDLLRITSIEDGVIRGKREHPQDWEHDVVFSVYPVQLRERGVLLMERSEAGDSHEKPEASS